MKEMRTPADDAGTCIDAGYHYEEFRQQFDYGIWDCPGTPGGYCPTVDQA